MVAGGWGWWLGVVHGGGAAPASKGNESTNRPLTTNQHQPVAVQYMPAHRRARLRRPAGPLGMHRAGGCPQARPGRGADTILLSRVCVGVCVGVFWGDDRTKNTPTILQACLNATQLILAYLSLSYPSLSWLILAYPSLS